MMQKVWTIYGTAVRKDNGKTVPLRIEGIPDATLDAVWEAFVTSLRVTHEDEMLGVVSTLRDIRGEEVVL